MTHGDHYWEEKFKLTKFEDDDNKEEPVTKDKKVMINDILKIPEAKQKK